VIGKKAGPGLRPGGLSIESSAVRSRYCQDRALSLSRQFTLTVGAGHCCCQGSQGRALSLSEQNTVGIVRVGHCHC
jgi:hypothetical protein